MSDAGAREELVGRQITGVAFFHDFIEVHFEDDLILTGYTEPFGTIGCAGVGEVTMRWFIGKRVDGFVVEPGKYVAIDSREMRLAFPIDEESERNGPEAVRLYQRGHDELGEPAKHWIW